MKNILFASLIALAFTTGFTCSKNAPTDAPMPEATATTVPAGDMAAPADAGTPAGDTTTTTVTQ